MAYAFPYDYAEDDCDFYADAYADADADADADAEADADADADFTPAEGAWTYTTFTVASTSCAGVSEDVVKGLSEDKGFSISGASPASFTWLIDGFPESRSCALSGHDFDCDTLSGNIDNDYVDLPTLIETQGSFSDEHNSTGTYEAAIDCDGPLCSTVEGMYGISFPCDFNFTFSATRG